MCPLPLLIVPIPQRLRPEQLIFALKLFIQISVFPETEPIAIALEELQQKEYESVPAENTTVDNLKKMSGEFVEKQPVTMVLDEESELQIKAEVKASATVEKAAAETATPLC